ncbi:MAG: hypothetical protein IJC76_02330 [Lachnospiraceae bacterium]|nr:hypothetical protein [Lachnospiraceae bacterium]
MLRIIIGLLLILFELNLGAGSYRIGLIPDFIGYVFLFFGMKAEQEKCLTYKKDKLYMIPFCLFSYAIYMGDLYGIIEGLVIPVVNIDVRLLCTFISMLLGIYTTYSIYKGVKTVEESFSVELKTKRIMYIWRIRVLCSFMEYLSLILVVGEMYLVMAIANIISGIVMAVYVTQVAIIYSELKRNNRLKSKGER